ncbi:MAG: right-handed parallel beta-helix repeat-containing protein [Mucilaginibacter polytrichastri]|nr:right-handed parallel beta-helix repeat-containing protein [Mucilaginibacter polytrichastri]
MKKATPADSTTYLNKLVAESYEREIRIPPGTYYIDSLMIPHKDRVINGDGVTLIMRNSSRSKNLVWIPKSGVTFENFRLIGPKRDTALKCNGVHTWGTKNMVFRNLRVSGFYGIGINMLFTNNALVEKNHVTDGIHGIQFWGGEASIMKQSIVKNIILQNNFVDRMKYGGIWGSCGDSIMIRNNEVAHCGDVGVDYEKCTKSVMEGNVVSDCKNGGISFFFGCEKITAINNTVTQNIKAPGIKFFGGKYTHRDIVLKNNKVLNSQSGIFFDHGSGKRIHIVNNSIRGITGIKALNCDSIYVDSNKFMFTNATVGINNEGGSIWRIKGNTLRNERKDDPAQNSSVGIRTYYHSDKHPAQRNEVIDNTVEGFAASILDDRWGDPKSLSGLYSGNTIETFFVNENRVKNDFGKSQLNAKPGEFSNRKRLKSGNGVFINIAKY